MDWSKAKNILIIGFIITNVFLIYNIQKDMYNRNNVLIVDDKIINDTKSILKEKDIGVDTQVPKIVIEMAPLDVEYETYDEDKLKENLVGARGLLTIENNKLLKYRKSSLEEKYFLDRESALKTAEDFVSKIGFKNKGEEIWHTSEYNNRYEILYKQSYKDMFLEDSYMKVIVSTNGVEAFERIWLKPMEKEKSKREIMPATKALLKVMDDLEEVPRPIIIKDISLGYWFDRSKISFVNAENVKSGTAFPAWRIVLDNKEVKFVSAYDKY
ncbi:MAG: two-component system regulatory protein YycI [Anaeromicrobium sp.]|jgi:regulatory protein YycI of two-component signal transduction system YycFG|uniref:two-component system regulatory protein YycI n=1 Tax=Anaeromicrobium sp. TaxID=1929132 RepID=UPI0025EA8AE0|nr:two-component system regulatory protein YycI [Anaeromicrobium sp.]MCT4594309.1 two-component system regulatory protein YycI [Anaeromicrobium sp.]